MNYEVLRLQDIHKSYGLKPVLQGASFHLNRGQRAALVGENGAGKTTLARLILGQEQPDIGQIHLAEGAILGYLPQEAPSDERSIGQYIRQAQGDLDALEAEMRLMEEHLAQADAEMLARYGVLQDAYERRGGYDLPQRLRAVQRGLAIDYLDEGRSLASLSGGERTRVALASLLLRAPDLLVLDEPTNHLDAAGLRWLEDYLRAYPHAVLLISHDRAFIDATAQHILDLAAHTGRITAYHGTTEDYLQARQRDYEQALAAYEAQLEEEKRLLRLVKHTVHNTRRHIEAPDGDKMLATRMKENADHTRSAKIRDAKQRLALLDDERLDNPRRAWTLAYDFDPLPLGSAAPLHLQDLRMGYAAPLFAGLSAALYRGERVALVAPNGAGKSTLLKLVAGLLRPWGGQIHLAGGVRLGYLSQDGEELDGTQGVIEALRQVAPHLSARQAQAELHRVGLFGDEALLSKTIGQLSAGQRRKLGLARLLVSRANLLLLDEPTNHLDLLSLAALEEGLRAFPGAMLAATHDRRFIEGVATQVWHLQDGRLRLA